jgi:hypothetical protein
VELWRFEESGAVKMAAVFLACWKKLIIFSSVMCYKSVTVPDYLT